MTQQLKLYVIGCFPLNMDTGEFVDEEAEPSLWWNNDSGWGCLSTAAVYSEEELNQYTLPMEGKWIELPPVPERLTHKRI